MTTDDKNKFRKKMAHMSMAQIKALAYRTRKPSAADKARLNEWMKSPDYQAIKENDTPGSPSDPQDDATQTITKYLPKINNHLANIERLLTKIYKRNQ